MFARSWITALAVAASTGCVEGLSPPEPTHLVEIAGGAFLFGSTEPCFNIGQTVVTCKDDGKYGMPKIYPAVVVDLGDFAIDEHEVTNLQYEYCVANDACPEPEYNNTIGVEHYFLASAYQNYPVVNVTPDMAAAYCTFIGRRLPTEAEWERAATGGGAKVMGDEGLKRKYPYMGGKETITDCVGMSVAMGYCTGLTKPAAVKASTDDWVEEGSARLWDFTGNVAELVSGFYDEDLTCLESIFEGQDPCTDCFGCDSMECKENCYLTCQKCEDDPDCFKQCDDDLSFPGFPRCISYGTDVQDPAILTVSSGNEWLARGGSFNDEDAMTCRALATDRNSPTRRGKRGSSSPLVGFRCVEDR